MSVYQKEDGKWGFIDEMGDAFGTYETEAEATMAFANYCSKELQGLEAEIIWRLWKSPAPDTATATFRECAVLCAIDLTEDKAGDLESYIELCADVVRSWMKEDQPNYKEPIKPAC
jgi:hypothetical protein